MSRNNLGSSSFNFQSACMAPTTPGSVMNGGITPQQMIDQSRKKRGNRMTSQEILRPRDNSQRPIRKMYAGSMNAFGSGHINSYIHKSSSHFFENNYDDDGQSSYVSGSAADFAPGYEVDDDDLLYDKNIKKENYKLFSLRENSVVNFHSIINFEDKTRNDS